MFLLFSNQEDFTGSRVKKPDTYLLDIQRMNGTDLHTLELRKGVILHIQFETEKGSLYMEIKAPDGTCVYRGNGKEATDFTVNIQESGVYTIVVEACPLESFYPAEEYHQKYLDKTPGGYCHVPWEEIDWVKTVDLRDI